MRKYMMIIGLGAVMTVLSGCYLPQEGGWIDNGTRPDGWEYGSGWGTPTNFAPTYVIPPSVVDPTIGRGERVSAEPAATNAIDTLEDTP